MIEIEGLEDKEKYWKRQVLVRLNLIGEAIERYDEADRKIPAEWEEETNQILDFLNDRKNEQQTK